MLIIEASIQELQKEFETVVPRPSLAEIPTLSLRWDSTKVEFPTDLFLSLMTLLKNFSKGKKYSVVAFGGSIVRLALNQMGKYSDEFDLDLTFLSPCEFSSQELKVEAYLLINYLIKNLGLKGQVEKSCHCFNLSLDQNKKLRPFNKIQILTKVFPSWTRLFEKIDLAATAIAYHPQKEKIFFEEEAYEALQSRCMVVNFKRVVGASTFNRMVKYLGRGFEFRLPNLDTTRLFDFFYPKKRTSLAFHSLEGNQIKIMTNGLIDLHDYFGSQLPLSENSVGANRDEDQFQTPIEPKDFYHSAYLPSSHKPVKQTLILPNKSNSHGGLRLFLQICPFQGKNVEQPSYSAEPLQLLGQISGQEIRKAILSGQKTELVFQSQANQKFVIQFKALSSDEEYGYLRLYFRIKFEDDIILSFEFRPNRDEGDHVILIDQSNRSFLFPASSMEKAYLLKFQKELTIENSLPFYVVYTCTNSDSEGRLEISSQQIKTKCHQHHKILRTEQPIYPIVYSKLLEMPNWFEYYRSEVLTAYRSWFSDCFDDMKPQESHPLINFNALEKQSFWRGLQYFSHSQQVIFSGQKSFQLWLGIVGICYEIGLLSCLKNGLVKPSLKSGSKSNDPWVRYIQMINRLPDDLLKSLWTLKWNLIEKQTLISGVQEDPNLYKRNRLRISHFEVSRLSFDSDLSNLSSRLYEEFVKFPLLL